MKVSERLSRGYKRRLLWLIPALLTIILGGTLLAACGETASTDSKDPLSEFKELSTGEPSANDIEPDSASLLWDSKVDVICAWALGPTTDYGQVLVHDGSSMSALTNPGHTTHELHLVALQPGTVYHYRIGGIGPDGTVFRSDDFTFRTAPE